MRGFIGCMRFLFVEGRYIDAGSLTSDRKEGQLLLNACQMVDRWAPLLLCHSLKGIPDQNMKYTKTLRNKSNRMSYTRKR